MAKKTKSTKKRSKSQKWSRANIANYVLGGIVAVSMLVGGVFAFGGVSPQASAPAPAPVVATFTPMAPAVQQGVTPTATDAPTKAP